MKRITLLIATLVLGSAIMAQSAIPERDLQRLQMEQAAQFDQINDKDPDASGIQTEPSDAMFDLLFQFPVGVGGGEYAVATDGNFIYTAAWNSANFYKYQMDGTYLESFTIAGAGNCRDLTYDGEYFYAAPNTTTIYQMDFTNQTLVGTITAPAAVRGIAYDPDNDGFWVTNGWNPPIRLISRTGTVLATLNTAAASLSGLGWEDVTEGSPHLWAYTQPASNNILVQIDINTGATLQTYDVANSVTFQPGSISGGMVITDQVYPGKWAFLGTAQNDNIWALELADAAPAEAPGAATNLAAVAGAMGALNAEINWNNPGLTVGGEPLTELTAVMLHRDGELIHTINNPVIGGAESFTDNNVPAAGNITYTVIGENSAGEGIPANVTVYVGEDVPAAPGNVVLVAQDNDGFITWNAPTEGLNGGYFTGENVTYTLVRFPGAVQVADGLMVLEFLDTTIPGIGNYYYEVTAVNDIGTGGTGTSNIALLGAMGTLLFETFDIAVGALPDGWNVLGAGAANWGAANTSNAGVEAPEMRLYWSPSFIGESRLITHAINSQSFTALRLKLNNFLNNYASSSNVISIGYSIDGGTNWTTLWEYVCVADYGPVLEEFYFGVPANTDFHIGFHFTGDSWDINWWNFDNVIVEAFAGGALEGVVTEAKAPIGDVLVKILGTEFETYTNAAGEYEFPTVNAGTYNVEFSKYGFETLVIEDVVIVADETTVLNVSLNSVGMPVIAVTPESISEVLPVGGMSEHEVSISNLGELPLNWSASLQYPDRAMAYPADQGANRSLVEVERDPDAVPINIDPTDDLYDLLFQFPVGVGGGEYSVATDGNFIYTAAWNSANFYKYQMDGTYLESFTIAGAGNCRDLTYDGEYFYAAPNTTTIYQMDFTNQTLVGTITAPAAVRGIAYDADNDGFWVTNGWNPPIRLISRTGTVLETLNTVAASLSGLGWENVLDGAPNLWAYTQPASNNILVKIDINTGATLETYDVANSVTFQPGSISGGMMITDQVYPGKWAFLGTAQNDVIWALELADAGTPWVSIAPRTGSVPGGESDVMLVSFNAEEVEPGTYLADIVINSNDPDNPTVVVPVTLVVGDEPPLLLGDANCDGVVNVTDVLWTINYILGNNPEPFCFENADVNGDGFVNAIDVLGIVNIILNEKASVSLNSAPANLYLNRDNITLQSDGTLAALQFEIAGEVELNFVLPGYEFMSNEVDGKLIGMIFSFDNTPLPAGEVTLFNFNETAGLKWGNVVAGNYNAEEIAVNKFMGDVVLNIFPNPAKDRLNVQANQVIDFVRLTNQLGQLVEETILQVESAVINTSHLRKGIYILEVHTAGDVSIQKIVIE